MPPIQTASETLAAAAALMRHLAASGVDFVPRAAPDAAGRLGPQFESPAPAAQEVAAQTPAAAARSPRGPAATPAAAAPRRDLTADSPPGPGTLPGPGTPPTGVAAISRPASRLGSIGSIGNPAAYPGPSLPIDQRRSKLAALADVVAGCTRCGVLASCRKQTVFGEGDPRPRFVFFGEAPGAEEDASGRPFVGRAGQLLDKMIQACGIRREDTYILNTIKCRPPGNRNPEPTEVENCRPYFTEQLDILRPEYIICLGAVGTQAVLQSKLSVGRLRGELHRYFDSKVLVTYHPAYLLRNPDVKRAAWADLQLMMRDAGLKQP